MILLIDHKPAAIKEGSSFEYSSDNRLFNDRDDYSMSIELPLDIAENAAIFGHINRKDADIDTIYFDAEIIAGNFHQSGAVVLTSITDTMAKVQFISGRSFQNFYPTFDNTYIDELELGTIPRWLPDNISELDTSAGSNNRNDRTGNRNRGAGTRPGTEGNAEDPAVTEYKSPVEAWGTDDVIALPWVNASSGNIQNRADYGPRNDTNQWYWHVKQEDDDDTEIVRGLSCQARLYYIVQLICTALGYEFIGDGWRNSDFYYLYSFNAVPFAWGTGRWEDTLPHWSVNEFFDHLEKLMLCEFDIDHKSKKISFSWSNENVSNAGIVAIDVVVDEFTASVSKDDDSQYKANRNIGYTDGGHNMSNIYNCDWLFRKNKVSVKEYETLQDLVDYLNAQPLKWYRGYPWDMIFYAANVDNYFLLYVTGRYLVDRNQHSDVQKYANGYRLLPLNAFGSRIFDDENWEEKEDIGIIPAWIDETDRGWIPFFDAGGTDNTATSGEEYKRSYDGKQSFWDEGTVDPDQVLQGHRFRQIKEGDSDGETNYSNLQVGFWFGISMYYYGNHNGIQQLPHPILDEYEVVENIAYTQNTNLKHTFMIQQMWRNCSLRLNCDLYGQGATLAQTVNIETRHKYEFSFLMDRMPDVRATYIIRGKKYLCSSIKTDISENGMSQLKKGTFYRILE